MPFLETPPQEPFQEGYLLAYGAVAHVLLVTQEVHIVIQTVLGERVKGKFIPELFQVVFYRSEFFVGCVCPVVLFSAFPYKLLERLPKAGFRFFGYFLLCGWCILHPCIETVLYLYGCGEYVLYFKLLEDVLYLRVLS